jgi:hypothetical protein
VKILLASAFAAAAFQLYNECLKPFFDSSAHIGTIDWATIAFVQKETSSGLNEVLLAAAAYIYMGVSLFIYFVVLFYGTTFSAYLRKLSTTGEQLRLIWRDPHFEYELNDTVQRVFLGSLLGLGATYLMRLQVNYLQSDASNVFAFMFSGERQLLYWLTGNTDASSAQIAQNIATVATSAWTSFAVSVYAVFMFSVAFMLLSASFTSTKEYYMANIDREYWRRQRDVAHEPKLIARLQQLRFLAAVPQARSLAILAVGMIASCFLPQYGSILIATLAYGVWHLMRSPRRVPLP